MTVTDPDVPDPLNDPRTLQADPGAYGQGEDLASTGDDAASTGEDELTAGRDGLVRFGCRRPGTIGTSQFPSEEENRDGHR